MHPEGLPAGSVSACAPVWGDASFSSSLCSACGCLHCRTGSVPPCQALWGVEVWHLAYGAGDSGLDDLKVSGKLWHQASVCLWHTRSALTDPGSHVIAFYLGPKVLPSSCPCSSQPASPSLLSFLRVWATMHHDGIVGGIADANLL